jgi:hypothetical protein
MTRPLRRALLAGVVAAVTLVATAPHALADTELKVTVGYGGYVQAGRPYPVRITVTADQLVSGTLRVTGTVGQNQTVQEIPIDAAGGSTKEYTVLAQSYLWEPGQVTVELVDGDDVVTSARGVGRDPQQNDLVGVFPGAVRGELAERADTLVGDAVALLFPLAPDDLAIGWGVLGPLDTVVATGDDLRELPEASMDRLLTWVGRGGQLVVDEPAGTDVPGLPDEWQPGDRTRAAAGQGEVALSGGSAAAGAWDELLLPSPVRSFNEADAYGQFGGFFGGGSIVSELGEDAGFDVPAVWWLITILGAYILLAGPVLWFILRRAGRQGLTWLVVPATAVVFTGVVAVLGAGLRESTQDAHGTIIEVNPRGSLATSAFLLSSRSGGEVGLSLPAGWAQTTAVGEDYYGGGTSVIRVAGDRVSADLDAGGFAIMRAAGPARDFDGALTVTAVSTEPGTVVGTITNNTDVELHEVGVFADLTGDNLGSLPAGATVEFELAGGVAAGFGEPPEFRIWREALGPEFNGQPVPPAGDDDRAEGGASTVNVGLWSEVSAMWGISGRAPGDLVVAGWTDELASPAVPDIRAGRTLLVTRAVIVADGDAGDMAGRRFVVRGPSGVPDGFPRGDNNEYIVGGQMRLLLPTEEDGEPLPAADLVLALPANQKRVELWVDGAWRELDIEPKRAAVVALPPEAVVADSVFLRTYLNFSNAMNLRAIALRSPTERDEVLPAAYRASGTAEEA